MRSIRSRPARLLCSAALAVALAASVAGCKTTGSGDITGSTGAAAATRSENEWRRTADAWEARYRANPADLDAAINYAQALRATDRRQQAAAVLEQASIRHPRNMAVLGAYGRALADVGRYQRAVDVLGRAHAPDRPDWRILSAQGAVLDQMGQHAEAQRYYANALKIAPGEPSVMSNLGLSYALAKNLPRAEATLRQAAAHRSADPRVRQNLALVVGLQGRFAEAEKIARADLPPDEAAANVLYLRQMLARNAGLTNQEKQKPSKRRHRS